MTDKPENPLAFPSPPSIHPPYDEAAGMTLRDYFAGQALTGFCTNISDIPYGEIVRWDRLSQEAYEAADAMLKERSK